MKSFIVYILYSAIRNRYYVGSCADMGVRFQQHNTGRNKSTKSGVPWIIVYQEGYATQPEARRREAEIKNKKSRKYIEWLVAQK